MSASRLRQLVSSFEKKYGSGNPRNDYVVDITTMDVVDDGRRRTKTRKTIQSTPVKARTSTSSNVAYVCPPGFTNNGHQMAMYRPPADSELFNSEYQVNALNHLYTILVNEDQDGSFRRSLIEKAFKTLGLKTLPSSDTVHPFIHISDQGAPSITFLYDSPPHTPWRSYMEVIFPKEAMDLSRKIYDCLLNPFVHRNMQEATNSVYPRNGDVIENGAVDSDGTISEDFYGEYFPSRRASQRTRRPPKKLTSNIGEVLDPSDGSSINESVAVKPKRKRTVKEPQSENKKVKISQKRVSKPRRSTKSQSSSK